MLRAVRVGAIDPVVTFSFVRYRSLLFVRFVYWLQNSSYCFFSAKGDLWGLGSMSWGLFAWEFTLVIKVRGVPACFSGNSFFYRVCPTTSGRFPIGRRSVVRLCSFVRVVTRVVGLLFYGRIKYIWFGWVRCGFFVYHRVFSGCG